MKYKFTVTCPPHIISTTVFDNQEDLMKKIVESKQLIIEVSTKTKQTISVNVRHGSTSLLVGYIPKGCEHLKFLEKWRSYVWDERQSSYCYYFKILKSQGWKEFKFYMEKLIDSLHLQEWAAHYEIEPVDELDVTVWMNDSLRMRMCEPTILKNLEIAEI